jgi:hypothetical protein
MAFLSVFVSLWLIANGACNHFFIHPPARKEYVCADTLVFCISIKGANPKNLLSPSHDLANNETRTNILNMNKASCHISTLQLHSVHCTGGGGVEGNAHGQINYIDTKAKCLHVKKLTCCILSWLIHPISRLEH